MRSCEEIINEVEKYRQNFDKAIIKKAYEFAKKKHEGQFRKSGEPFFSHPAEVAYILAKMRMDIPTIVAGLLHDTVEDTDATVQEIESEFGREIALIVEGVTKIEKYEFASKEEQDAESFRKLLLSSIGDIRVIMVKLADRLHNMRTLFSLSRERQIKMARETIDIYAQLAGRLGMYKLKSELEDLSFMYLEPERYKEIEEKVRKKKKKIASQMEKIINVLSKRLEEEGIKARISWRFKHLYSIYRKMLRKGIPFEEVYDIAGIRVITDSVENCYRILGIINSLWRPMPGRLKDYIVNPKPNNYRSLHTTVVVDKKQFVEFQIRTEEMHKEAEMGIAAHWVYKEGSRFSESEAKRIEWFRELLECARNQKNTKDFLESIKGELYEDYIYAITPKGDVITLPAGATPVDFAYKIHTSVGHRCKQAKVDGRIVPLDYRLKSGEVVEIITGKKEDPKERWLTFVRTSKARNAIRSFLRRKENEQAKKLGEKLVEKHLRKLLGKTVSELYDMEHELSEKLSSLGFKSLEQAFIDVGYRKIHEETLVRKLFGLSAPSTKKSKKAQAQKEAELAIEELRGVSIKFANCCYPIPGDEIVGIVETGKGIFIHTSDCVRARQIMEVNPDRVLKFSKSAFKADGKLYQAKIRVSANDRVGLLRDVSDAIASTGTSILSNRTITMPSTGKAVIDCVVSVRDIQHLEKVMNAIRAIKDVINVKRIKRRAPKKSRRT